MERPNPHKTTFNNMMLYLRYQVEEFAFKKWGGPEGLDAEYERRVVTKKERKDKKFLAKLKEMRRTTRANIHNSGKERQHIHEWSAGIKASNGMVRRRCAVCGLTTEEFVMG
jgi:DNA-repair protein complementing XP-A cells